MENTEIFDNEVRTLLVYLLEGNFVDKICHLASKGETYYTRHILLQERYELYQDSFDKITEYILTKYWTESIRKYIPSIHPELGENTSLTDESSKYRIKIQNQVRNVREVNSDPVLGSILDELCTKLTSLEFKLGF